MKAFVAGLMLITMPIAVGAQAPAPPSSERIEAARPVIDQLWPIGTYRRMMDGTMSKLMDSMMSSMMGMPAENILGSAATGEAGKKSMAELAESADPHFRERMKISMDTMMGAMIPIMEKIEPTVRDNLTRVYARQFTAVELGDMRRFFATPSGKAYADNAMMMFTQPEIMEGMQAFLPELMQAMPGIMKKVEAATAHLPPPPKRKSEE